MNLINKHPWLAITLLLTVLFGFQVGTISYQNYFMDEVEELHFAQGDFWKSVFMTDSMPPLFTLSLRGWLAVFSDRIDARWMSACLSLISTFAIFRFVKFLSNSSTAFISAALFAFSPLQLYYAQLIRGYALMTCISVFCIGFFFLAVKSSKNRHYAGFAIFSIVGMYAHYYFAMIPIALFVVYLWQRNEHKFSTIAMCYFAMFVLTSPVLIFLADDFKYQHGLRDPLPMSFPAIVYTYFSYFSGYALGPSQRELQFISSAAAIRSAVPWLLACAAIGLPLASRGIGALRQKGLLVPILSLLTVPLILIGVAGLLGGITYNVRFVAWFAFPLSVLFGFAFNSDDGRCVPKWVMACGAGVFGIFAVANFNRVFNPRYQFEDVRGAAKFLLENRTGGEPVFVVSDYMLQPLAHYFVDDREQLFELPQLGTRSKVIDNAEEVAQAMQVVDANSQSKRSWLVYSRPFHGDPRGLMLDEFCQRGASLSHRFAGVDLYLVPRQP
jgi:hypothetical protein